MSFFCNSMHVSEYLWMKTMIVFILNSTDQTVRLISSCSSVKCSKFAIYVQNACSCPHVNISHQCITSRPIFMEKWFIDFHACLQSSCLLSAQLLLKPVDDNSSSPTMTVKINQESINAMLVKMEMSGQGWSLLSMLDLFLSVSERKR